MTKLAPYRFTQQQTLTIADLSSIVINTGKTPANQVQVHYTITMIPITEPVPTWDAFTQTWLREVTEGDDKTPKSILDDFRKSIRGETDVQFDLPPTVTHLVHLVQMPNQAFTRDAFASSQLTLYILGQIAYVDNATHQHHTTTLCLMNRTWAGGVEAFTYCQTGNTMN